MSISVTYVRLAADHIELLQKDIIDVWHDLHPDTDFPDHHPNVNDILYDLPGDVEIINMDGWEVLSWLLSPLKREETRPQTPDQLAEQSSWPTVDLPLVAIEGRDSQLGIPAINFGLGEGAALDSTTVQKLSKALSQITPDDLLRNFDFDAMQRIDLPGFGRSFAPNEEEERATEERLARECVSRQFQELQQFYQRAAASGQYVIVGFA
jgi:hypothetical protein